MGTIDEVKSRLDIVDFIAGSVQIKKTGRNYKGLCPFHGEKTPSFVVFPDSQSWRCFGCGRGGDIFAFAMELHGWDFTEAMHQLASMAGVELRPLTPQQSEAKEKEERYAQALHEAAILFHKLLMGKEYAAGAYEYVVGRGLNDETLNAFLIGYAPDSWDYTSQYLLQLGFAHDDLVQAGLVVERDDSRMYDRFRHRLMIPIRNASEQVVGFGARGLASDAVPKYLNSPQSLLFDKSTLLFAFPEARRRIRETETAVIVEGYMDVLQAHQAGFANVVAQMGTSLTEPQLRLLARYARQIVLALDADAAGQMATQRGRETIERASEQVSRQMKEEAIWGFDAAEREYRGKLSTEFDPQGMIHYENALGFDIRVLTLPFGKDPDDLIREAPHTWQQLVDTAVPIIEYTILNATEGQNLDDPKVKRRIADQIIPLVNNVSDPVERTHYRQRLARLLKLPENAFLTKAAAPTAQRRQRPEVVESHHAPGDVQVESLVNPTQWRETFCLAALLRYPRLIYYINRILVETFLADGSDVALSEDAYRFLETAGFSVHVMPEDFAHPDHRHIFYLWQQALVQDDFSPETYLIEHLNPEMQSKIRDWLEKPLDALKQGVVPQKNPLSIPDIGNEAISAVLELREKRLNDYLSSFVSIMQDMDNGGRVADVVHYRDAVQLILKMKYRVAKKRKENKHIQETFWDESGHGEGSNYRN